MYTSMYMYVTIIYGKEAMNSEESKKGGTWEGLEGGKGRENHVITL